MRISDLIHAARTTFEEDERFSGYVGSSYHRSSSYTQYEQQIKINHSNQANDNDYDDEDERGFLKYETWRRIRQRSMVSPSTSSKPYPGSSIIHQGSAQNLSPLSFSIGPSGRVSQPSSSLINREQSEPCPVPLKTILSLLPAVDDSYPSPPKVPPSNHHPGNHPEPLPRRSDSSTHPSDQSAYPSTSLYYSATSTSSPLTSHSNAIHRAAAGSSMDQIPYSHHVLFRHRGPQEITPASSPPQRNVSPPSQGAPLYHPLQSIHHLASHIPSSCSPPLSRHASPSAVSSSSLSSLPPNSRVSCSIEMINDPAQSSLSITTQIRERPTQYFLNQQHTTVQVPSLSMRERHNAAEQLTPINTTRQDWKEEEEDSNSMSSRRKRNHSRMSAKSAAMENQYDFLSDSSGESVPDDDDDDFVDDMSDKSFDPHERKKNKQSTQKNSRRSFSPPSEEPRTPVDLIDSASPAVGSDQTVITRHRCTIRGCYKSFSKSKDLTAHMSTHMADRPHGCPQCSARFRRRQDMYRHVRSVHDDPSSRPHPCENEGCFMRFARADGLAAHMRTCQNGQPAKRGRRRIGESTSPGKHASS